MNIIVEPLILSPKRVLNSLWSVDVILIHKILGREGISQNIGGIINSPTKVLSQLIDEFQFVEGSKDEKRFAIIFS